MVGNAPLIVLRDTPFAIESHIDTSNEAKIQALQVGRKRQVYVLVAYWAFSMLSILGYNER